MLKLRSKPCGIPVVSPGLLADLHQFARWVDALDETIRTQVRFVVSTSGYANSYNLGGDLAFFSECIREQRFDDLTQYAHRAVETVYAIRNAFGLKAITIAQCNGKALGGGFECSLAHDYIIASETAGFSFPEKKFNLFPGMGAYSLLYRKLEPKRADQVLKSDRIFTPQELQKIGLVSAVYNENEADQCLNGFVNRLNKLYNFEYFHLQCNKHIHPVSLDELYAITDYWVESCKNLQPKDLDVIRVLVAAQQRAFLPKPAHFEMS